MLAAVGSIMMLVAGAFYCGLAAVDAFLGTGLVLRDKGERNNQPG